ncbi:MAG: GNAT family N-acetyltransferase [Pseudomonadales bacterium]
MSDDDTVDYTPVSVTRASWSDEHETILTCRSLFLPELASEQVFDISSLHFLAQINENFVGYLCIDRDGHISYAITQAAHAQDIAEALLRNAVMDAPRRGLSQLSVPAAHPWASIFLTLGFSTENSHSDQLLALFLPPNRSFITSGSGLVRLQTTDEFRALSLELVKNARYGLIIFSEDLEDWLYDNDAFADAVMALVQKQRNTSVRILVRDTKPLIERGHRLLRLSHRAAEYIQIRKLPTTIAEKFPNYLITDDNGLLFRPDPQETQGIGYHDYRARVKPLLEEFKQLWSRATTPADLRQQTL